MTTHVIHFADNLIQIVPCSVWTQPSKRAEARGVSVLDFSLRLHVREAPARVVKGQDIFTVELFLEDGQAPHLSTLCRLTVERGAFAHSSWTYTGDVFDEEPTQQTILAKLEPMIRCAIETIRAEVPRC